MLRVLIAFVLLSVTVSAAEPAGLWEQKTMIRTPHGDFSVAELEAYFKVLTIKKKLDANPTDSIKEIRNSKGELTYPRDLWKGKPREVSPQHLDPLVRATRENIQAFEEYERREAAINQRAAEPRTEVYRIQCDKE
jgi:hypothetical protein